MLQTSLNADSLASLPPAAREQILENLSDDEAKILLYDWHFWARAAQLPPPGDWQTWLILAGRGFGKTRTGAEWVRGEVESGRCKRVALVGPTAGDARDVMVEGESGILSICPSWFRPHYEPSKRRLTWANGAIATLYSADEPERLRGPQHDSAWCDEIASWRFPEAWDLLQFGLRLGTNPRAVATTTPKPIKLVRDLLTQSTTVITRGTTYENKGNLAPQFIQRIIARYEGTRLGRQELRAEILEDAAGALWKRDLLEELRVSTYPELKRVIVAIDPATTSEEGSNETGIIVAGLGRDDHGYILEDKSLLASPNAWATEAVKAYRVHKADKIIAEANQGGDMIVTTIATIDKKVPVKKVHASRGKIIRAEPVASLYEKRLVHHVGSFPELEDQLCWWEPGMDSPDRLDALVWAISELMLEPEKDKRLRSS
jgi:phage terminase large subunit-like protein